MSVPLRDLPTSRQALGLVGWLAAAYAAAGIGAIASVDAAAFYRTLALPAWAPPSWLFGPVWTVLYGLMGVAAWLVWRRAGFARATVGLTLFLVQLAINALWSWLFFAWRLGGAAFADVVVLWVLVGATLLAFARVSTAAGLLLAPYLAWITYAAALNFVAWIGNPQQLG